MKGEESGGQIQLFLQENTTKSWSIHLISVFIHVTMLLAFYQLGRIPFSIESPAVSPLPSLNVFSRLILTGVLAFLVYQGIQWIRGFKRMFELVEKIPGPPRDPLLGHTILVLQMDRVNFQHGTYVLLYQMLSSINLLYEKEKICRFWLGLRPFVVLYTPEAVEVVLSSNTLTDKAVEYSFLKPWLGEGIVTSNKLRWKNKRKILTPAFHFRILKDYLPIINDQASVLVRKLYRLCDEGASEHNGVDIMPIITLCTLDVICETAMGVKVKCQEQETDYVNALHQIAELILFRLSRPWFWSDFLFFSSKHGRRFRKCLQIMQEFTVKVIKERKEDWLNHRKEMNDVKMEEGSSDSSPTPQGSSSSALASASDCLEKDSVISPNNLYYGGKKRLAFLDLLLEEHLINNTLTINDVRDEVDTFMFAGHDTTAMAISWTLYMLGLHPEIQEKVKEEIDYVLEGKKEDEEGKKRRKKEEDDDDEEEEGEMKIDGDGDGDGFTLEDVKKMKFLDCVLKEVQRLYPTAPFIGRELCQDTEINGYLVPKGTTCGLFTFLLHRNPSIFPDPEIFDPQRFSPKNCVGRHPYAYIPFSAGPRNCIGQKFALMEEKIVVANVVKNFHLRAVEQRDKLVVSGEMVLRSRNGLRLIITPRSKAENQQSFGDKTPSSPHIKVNASQTLGTGKDTREV